jgi:hypothetical protein
MSGGEQFSKNQHIARDGNDAMRPYRAIGCRPGEHQVAKNWHEFVGPNQSGHTEHKIQLNNSEEDQIIHFDDLPRKRQFYYNSTCVWQARSRKYKQSAP